MISYQWWCGRVWWRRKSVYSQQGAQWVRGTALWGSGITCKCLLYIYLIERAGQGGAAPGTRGKDRVDLVLIFWVWGRCWGQRANNFPTSRVLDKQVPVWSSRGLGYLKWGFRRGVLSPCLGGPPPTPELGLGTSCLQGFASLAKLRFKKKLNKTFTLSSWWQQWRWGWQQWQQQLRRECSAWGSLPHLSPPWWEIGDSLKILEISILCPNSFNLSTENHICPEIILFSDSSVWFAHLLYFFLLFIFYPEKS